VFVEDSLQISDLLRSVSQRQSLTEVIPAAIEWVRGHGHRRSTLQQTPDEIVVVGAGRANRFINTTHLKQLLPFEQKEVFQVTGLRLWSRLGLVPLYTQSSLPERDGAVGIEKDQSCRNDVGVVSQADLDSVWRKPVIGAKESHPPRRRGSDAMVESPCEATSRIVDPTGAQKNGQMSVICAEAFDQTQV
jgi:hypothetical protein